MSTTPPTVFIVDDDPPFLVATARLLRASGFAVETFPSAGEFLAGFAADSPGCLVLDLQMPEMTGLDLQRALNAAGVRLPVLFLTGNGDIQSSVQAMRGGADDFLEKRAPKQQLLAAIRRALIRDARERLVRARQRDLLSRFEVLSEREREVLHHVVRGQMNKQIALELGISERTVKAHRNAITTSSPSPPWPNSPGSPSKPACSSRRYHRRVRERRRSLTPSIRTAGCPFCASGNRGRRGHCT